MAGGFGGVNIRVEMGLADSISGRLSSQICEIYESLVLFMIVQ